MYEYVPDFKSDAWAAFKRGLATNTIGSGGSQTSRAKTILLGGRKDGHICVFDWEDGRVIFSIDVRGVFLNCILSTVHIHRILFPIENWEANKESLVYNERIDLKGWLNSKEKITFKNQSSFLYFILYIYFWISLFFRT